MVGLALLLWRLLRLMAAAACALLAILVKLGRALASLAAPAGRTFRRRAPVLAPVLASVAIGVVVLAAGTSPSDTSRGPRVLAPAAGTQPLSAGHAREVSAQLGRTRPAAPVVGGIPQRYLHIYQHAAREYGLQWNILAAVGQIESDHGRSPLPGVKQGVNGAGAAGPAQFLGSTWARFGVDVHGSGRPNPYDPADAITSMAAYLKAQGAPQDWRQALYSYNHSWGYVDAVLSLSRRLAAKIP